jgi:hypothetical protein
MRRQNVLLLFTRQPTNHFGPLDLGALDQWLVEFRPKCCGKNTGVHFCTFGWNKSRAAASCDFDWQQWGEAVVSRHYLTRRASALIGFAKSTNDPKPATDLVHSAAGLTMPPADPSLQAPDVEPPAPFSARRRQMIEKFTSPQVFIRRHAASQICDVVVSVRGQEIVLHCPNYSQALKWARLECKSYKISEPRIDPLISGSEIEPHTPKPEIDPLGALDHDEELPLFLRSPRNN